MENNKIKRIVWAAVLTTFVFYCLILFVRLFVDGRYYLAFTERFVRSNFIPLKTLYEYAIKLAEDRINISTVIYNIFGNLIAFFPMGCYLPCLFEKIRTVKVFCVVILGMLLAVELLQPLLGVGFFDIDDIILNFAGAIAGYGIVHIPPINRLLKKIYIYK